MRPIRLQVEGFTCFRDAQQPLDFSQLSLFAISGRTGAGKSSVLDAIIFALYGCVPRLGKEGIAPLISHGRDRLSVCFDFTANGSAYRITRTVKRGKKTSPTQVKFEEITPGHERDISAAVRQADEEIVRLLGLKYDAFTQTVVLPQGEFQKFLRGRPDQQREILRDLLRTTVFERMRSEAEGRKRDYQVEVRSIEKRLEEEFKDVTAERLRALEAELADSIRRRDALATALAAERAHFAEIARRYGVTKVIHEARERLKLMDREAPRVDAKRRELEAARRAAPIVGLIDAVAACRRRLLAAQAEEKDAAARVKRTEADLADAQRALGEAERALEEIPALSDRIRQLDELKGDLERREVLRARQKELAATIPGLKAAVEEAQDAVTDALIAVEQAMDTVSRRQQELEATGHDPQLLALLEPLERQATMLDQAIEDRGRAEKTYAQAEADLGKAQVERDSCAAESDAANAALGDAAERREEAERAYAAAQDAHRAAALRSHLHEGDACPVCMQTIAAVPAVPVPPELGALKTAADKAMKAHEKASVRAQLAREALSVAADRVERALREVEQARIAFEAASRAVEELEGALQSAVASVAPVGVAAIAQWIRETCADLRRRQRAYHAALNALMDAQRHLAAAQRALAEKTEDLRRHRMAHEQATGELERVEMELDVIESRIGEVTKEKDPAAERKRLEERIQVLRENERVARGRRDEARQARAVAEEALDRCRKAARERETEEAEARRALNEALLSSGFHSEEAVRKAARDAAARKELDEAIQRFDRERHAVQHRLTQAEATLNGAEVDDDEYAAAQAAVQRLEAAWTAVDRRVVALTAEVGHLRRLLEKSEELRARHNELSGRLRLAAGLADDLRSDRFQQYLLDDAFTGLVRGASVRMQKMTDRYTLEWQDGAFMVVDHDNAGEVRRAETLSGGETFLASLSLALELSSQVLHASGALQVDSLFIDEGFGTLDRETLDTVISAIEMLGSDGGRMVGIISHIDDLTTRLPGRIVVEKGQGESTWRLEGK